jgi:hypothetical protein
METRRAGVTDPAWTRRPPGMDKERDDGFNWN